MDLRDRYSLYGATFFKSVSLPLAWPFLFRFLMDPTISATKVTYLCDTEKFIVGARHGICIKMSSQGQSSSRSRVGQCVG